MTGVKLSFCIPTYNRAEFLEKALTYFAESYDIPHSYEIIVSDNASPDNTREVVDSFIARGLPIRYFRRVENGGYEPNLASALRRASGEYTVYVADDDMLVIDGLIEAVRYLDENPDVTAAYAPWYLHDEQEGVDTGTFYAVDQDRKFERHEFLPLFAFVMDNHIFSEIAICRTAALRSAWVPRHFAYWAFAHLAHYLDQGSVAFLKTPFYRAVTVSRIQRDRPQAGNDELLDAWDRYRGGIEYFLYLGMKRGAVPDEPEIREFYEPFIRDFMCRRMAVAMRFWVARGDYLRGYELYTRLTLNGMGHLADMQRVEGMIHVMAAIQTLAWLANATAEVDRLILSGFPDPQTLAGALRDMKLREDIAVHVEEPELSDEERDRAMVFLGADVDRETFVARGFAPGLVLSDQDLARTVLA